MKESDYSKLNLYPHNITSYEKIKIEEKENNLEKTKKVKTRNEVNYF